MGSSLNYSSSWSWLENYFLNEVIFMPQYQCLRTARLSPKKFLNDKLVFHLEILQNIILEVFPYLDDGSVSGLLRSCPRVPVI
jgi:hypothetical protein